jgi:hypothetical protein
MLQYRLVTLFQARVSYYHTSMVYILIISFFEIKIVCENLRKKNVTGHLGVFSEYFEPDNSRLQVTCSKHLSEEELKSIFAPFGTFHVKCAKLEGCQVKFYR